MGQRQAATDETKARIIKAARELLESGGMPAFSIEAVAKGAGVSRMTIYHKFESRAGLLEALLDDFASRSPLERIPEIFKHADPLDSLDAFVATFGDFWQSRGTAGHRLMGAANADPELATVLRERNERRREIIRVLLNRAVDRYSKPSPEEYASTVDVLFALTSFEFFRVLAGDRRSLASVSPQVQQLVRAALGFSPRPRVVEPR
jgi:AcrR family transcriptional regulator